MPVFINSGGSNAIHQLSFGSVTQSTVNFLQNQLATIQNTPYLQSFLPVAQMQFENLNGESARRAAEAVIRNATALFEENVIRQLNTIEQLQTASLVMQRWIMTSTLLREQAAAGHIYGWRDTYVDHEPGMTGIFNTDYRRLNQGILQEVEDGDWKVTQYFEECPEGEEDLTISKKVDIFSSISFAEQFVKAREEDPTSPYGDFM